jgi:hypothetical protein
MEERIITVESIEQKTGKKGAYLTVHGSDGKNYNIFDNKLFDIFEVNKAIKLSGETNGAFFNTKNAEPVGELINKMIEKGGKVTSVEPMTKEDWQEKDRITRKSIERQKSLEMALKALEVGAIDADKVIPTAKRFEQYLGTGE